MAKKQEPLLKYSIHKKQTLKELTTLHQADTWHEDDGNVIWWMFEGGWTEPPWVGTPLDEDWIKNYFTHWSPIPIPKKVSNVKRRS